MAAILVSNIEMESKNYARRVESNLELLTLIESGDEKTVKNILMMKVKSGLKPVQYIGDPLVDSWTKELSPSEETLIKAKNYQEEFCTEACLGI